MKTVYSLLLLLACTCYNALHCLHVSKILPEQLDQQLFDAIALAKIDSEQARTQFQDALSSGANPDAKDSEGTPIFSKAMQLNDFDDDYFFCVQLVQAGANVNATNADGVSLLLQAIGVYRVDITMLLEYCMRTERVIGLEDTTHD